MQDTRTPNLALSGQVRLVGTLTPIATGVDPILELIDHHTLKDIGLRKYKLEPTRP